MMACKLEQLILYKWSIKAAVIKKMRSLKVKMTENFLNFDFLSLRSKY